MSTKSVLRDLMPENEDAGFQKDTITLANGATIEVEPNPVYEETRWLWRIDNQIFSVDAYAENFLRKRVTEKLTGKRILLRAKGKVPEICGNICPHPEHNRALCDYCPIAEAAAADEDGLELILRKRLWLLSWQPWRTSDSASRSMRKMTRESVGSKSRTGRQTEST